MDAFSKVVKKLESQRLHVFLVHQLSPLEDLGLMPIDRQPRTASSRLPNLPYVQLNANTNTMAGPLQTQLPSADLTSYLNLCAEPQLFVGWWLYEARRVRGT